MRGHLLTAAALAALPCAAAGQTSELYINQYDSPYMVVVQGGNVSRSWNTVGAGENALSVAGGDIHTAGNRVFSTNGYEYDASGNQTGGPFSINLGGNYYDGTTDGVNYNYAVQHNGDYYVYRFDRNWANPQQMFSVGTYESGIAYDTTNGTLWTSDALNLTITNWDMNGNVISSFTPGDYTYAYGLALDPADGTLWVGGYGSNQIHGYDKMGNHQGMITVPNINTAFGMEFDARIPGPGGAALLGLSGLAAARRRR